MGLERGGRINKEIKGVVTNKDYSGEGSVVEVMCVLRG